MAGLGISGFLVTFCLSLLSAPLPEDDELVQEFLRFYKPRLSQREKIEAVYVLEKNNTVAGAEALTRVFDEKDLMVRGTAVKILGSFTDPESAQYLIQQFLLNKKEKKEHRILCAVESLGLMGAVDAIDPVLGLLQRNKKSWELRKVVGVTLGRLKSPRGLPALGLLLQDGDPTLRIIAVDAMASINHPEGSLSDPEDETAEPFPCQQALIELLGSDGDWQVRAAVISAMRSMRFKEAIQPLIDRLRLEEGRLKGDAYEALKELTFSMWEDKAELWQRYWDRVKDNFVMPDLTAVIEARKKRKKEGTRYSGASAEFAGIPTNSRRIIFVIDISGSMEQQVEQIERFRAGGKDYRTFQRLEIVKKELIATLGSFDGDVEFNILAFATKLKWWKKTLVRANIVNRNSAQVFVERLKALGGASAGFKKRGGLKKAAVIDEGRTNTYGALMAALGAPEESDDEDVSRKTFKNKVDTIFFLSDGDPTVGKLVDTGDIRQAVARVNEVRKVTLHTIAIGDFKKDFMNALAEENGGVYVDLGK